MFGAVEVIERVWRRAQKNYQRVFPGRIGVTARGKSRALQRVISDFGAEHSFAQASMRLQEHYGFTLHSSVVRAVTLATAQRARVKLEAKYAGPYRTLPAIGAEQIVAEADGTMICTVKPGRRKGQPRPREWKEMRLVVAQPLGSCQSVFAATFQSVDEVGKRWGHCARDAGWALQSGIHAVADGAEWIRLQGKQVFGEQHRPLCDFYHVSEYLAAAARHICPGQQERWRNTQQKRLKRGASDLVIAELHAHREPPNTPKEEAWVTNAHRYLFNRRDCLDYPAALALGLPIGSGLIESGHRHVLQARLKKAGTAWLSDHAEDMAQLRILRSNHHWPFLWN